MAGKCGLSGMTDYCASKYAANGFMEALRQEMKYQKKKIRCTTIFPTFINTGMFAGVKTTWLIPMYN